MYIILGTAIQAGGQGWAKALGQLPAWYVLGVARRLMTWLKRIQQASGGIRRPGRGCGHGQDFARAEDQGNIS